MTDDEREAIEAAGFRFVTIQEILGLSDADVEEIDQKIDAEGARSASEDVAKNGTVPWDRLEEELGLGGDR